MKCEVKGELTFSKHKVITVILVTRMCDNFVPLFFMESLTASIYNAIFLTKAATLFNIGSLFHSYFTLEWP